MSADGQIYERRDQLESTTLEIDDMNPTVKLTMIFEDWQKKKVKVPTHDLEIIEQVFYCFHKFLEVVRKLQVDGAEWLDYYRDTLRGHLQGPSGFSG